MKTYKIVTKVARHFHKNNFFVHRTATTYSLDFRVLPKKGFLNFRNRSISKTDAAFLHAVEKWTAKFGITPIITFSRRDFNHADGKVAMIATIALPRLLIDDQKKIDELYAYAIKQYCPGETF